MINGERYDERKSIYSDPFDPLDVVGSAARGERGLGSDIDYVTPTGNLPYYKGLEDKLPGIDPNHNIIPGYGDPNIGPTIRFEPKW